MGDTMNTEARMINTAGTKPPLVTMMDTEGCEACAHGTDNWFCMSGGLGVAASWTD